MLDEWAQMANRLKKIQSVVGNNFIRNIYKEIMKKLKIVLQFMWNTSFITKDKNIASWLNYNEIYSMKKQWTLQNSSN